MKMLRMAMVSAPCVVASMGCGKKEASPPAADEQKEVPAKQGDWLMERMENEPMP